MDDASVDPRVGSVLQERYRILERLAVGSMGIVYRAERLLLGRPLAVKFLHASYAADPTFIQRFERETRVMGRLAHPHCVSVIDFGVDGGPYVVMEFVDGGTLRALLEQGRVPVARAVQITRQILAGLAHAHSLGIIHRDIKPANIILMDATGTGDHVRILDFGLATLREAHSADISHSAIVIGTPNYMSPEQSVGGKADVRSDVYSTGVVLFELLTGRKPFTSDDTFELLSMHRNAPIPRLEDVAPDTDFPSGMQDVIDRALAKQQDERFQTAMEFAVALDETLEQAAAPARPVRQARQSTRPVVDREARGGRNGGDEPDYRRSLGVARSAAVRASRRRRRRRPSLFAAVIAVAVAGAAVFGGYALWQGAVGARLRAMIERPPPGAASAGARVPPTSSDPADTATKGIAPPAPGAESGSRPEGRGQPDGAGKTEGAPAPEGAATPAGAGEPEPPAEPASGAGAAGTDEAGPPPGDQGGGTEAGDPPADQPAGGAATAGQERPEMDMPAEPVLPVEEREEPVAPVADEDAKVDSAEPENAAEVKTPAARSAEVDSVAGAVALIKSGKREDAIHALVGLRRTQPRSAYVPYLLGNLYFEKGWWTLGMDYYDAAIRTNGQYRAKRILNQNLIRALGSKKTRQKAARMFVNSIGRDALPHLRQAARSDRDAQVRDWSRWLVGRIGQIDRRRTGR